MNLLLDETPSPWRRARGVLVALLATAVVLAATGSLARELVLGERWRVGEVQIVGNQRVSDAALRHLANLRRGTHLFTADLDRAVRGVEAHPWVAHASARRVFPGAVEIAVEEHHPRLILALDELWYVDEAGEPFTRADSDDLDYPVLVGLDPQLLADRPDVGQALVWGALRILDVWAARGRDEPPVEGDADALSEIVFDASHGYEVVLRTGSRLILGYGDPAAPLARLDRLIAAGLDLQTPQQVDLDAESVAIATPLPALPALP